jgi:hypothetical protein
MSSTLNMWLPSLYSRTASMHEPRAGIMVCLYVFSCIYYLLKLVIFRTTIVHVVFFALHHKQPEKQCFSLKTAVYPYVTMHWEALGLDEKSMLFIILTLNTPLTYLFFVDTTNWHKLIIDTLSHTPHLFVTGAHLVAR